MDTILALDPGVTTGYCLATHHDNMIWVAPDEARMTMMQVYKLLDNFVSLAESSFLIYESFEYRNRARAGLDLTPVKVIGIIELFAERYEPLLQTTKQSAASGKAFFTDDRLKQLGVYRVGRPHSRDATRHLLQWANFGAGGRIIDFQKCSLRMMMVDDLLTLHYSGKRL